MRSSLRFRVFLAWIGLLPLLASACSSAAVPPAKDVKGIKIDVYRRPGDKDFREDFNLKNPFILWTDKEQQKAGSAAKLDEADVADVLAWLNSVDWSKPSSQAAFRGNLQHDGMVLLQMEGGPRDYTFTWDGEVFHHDKGRYYRCADMDKLKQVVLRRWK